MELGGLTFSRTESERDYSKKGKVFTNAVDTNAERESLLVG